MDMGIPAFASSVFDSQRLRKQASLQKQSILHWRKMTGFLLCL